MARWADDLDGDDLVGDHHGQAQISPDLDTSVGKPYKCRARASMVDVMDLAASSTTGIRVSIGGMRGDVVCSPEDRVGHLVERVRVDLGHDVETVWIKTGRETRLCSTRYSDDAYYRSVQMMPWSTSFDDMSILHRMPVNRFDTVDTIAPGWTLFGYEGEPHRRITIDIRRPHVMSRTVIDALSDTETEVVLAQARTFESEKDLRHIRYLQNCTPVNPWRTVGEQFLWDAQQRVELETYYTLFGGGVKQIRDIDNSDGSIQSEFATGSSDDHGPPGAPMPKKTDTRKHYVF